MDKLLLELCVYDDSGALLFHLDFVNPSALPLSEQLRADRQFANRMKTVFGVVASLCDIVQVVSERTDEGAQRATFFSECETNAYKLSCHRSPTNLYFVLATAPDRHSYSATLKRFYETVFVEHACKSPLAERGGPAASPLLRAKARDFFGKALRQH